MDAYKSSANCDKMQNLEFPFRMDDSLVLSFMERG